MLRVLAVVAALTLPACTNLPAALTQLMEARRLASALHVEFTKAGEASNRAVMADTDEASVAAAEEARRARQAVERNLASLEPILQSLGYRDDVRHLEGFKVPFDEYRRLDDEILSLAVENSNLKAQRMAFGPARDAAEAIGTALDAAVRSDGAKDAPRLTKLVATVRIAVLEIRVLQPPHVAEPRDEEMTRLEGQMASSAGVARKALEDMNTTVGPDARPRVAEAAAAFDRFMATNGEIVKLSRRNSNVRSLALSLGRKRTVTAECEAALQALEAALAKHEFTATR